MKRRLSDVLMVVASIWLFWTIAAPSANAYIDPGSGSFILQILIGALAGAGLAIATFWRRIKLFFSKRKNGGDAAPAADAAQEPTGE